MDSLTFIAEIVEALAWPSATVVIVVLLRHQLRGLLPLLRSFKYKDIEIQFGRELKRLKAEVDAALPEVSDAVPEEVTELARTYPRGAILDAWHAVQSAAIAALERAHGSLPEEARGSQYRLVTTVERMDLLDARELAIYQHLRFLRNEAVHTPRFDLSAKEALDYVELAFRLVRKLNEHEDTRSKREEMPSRGSILSQGSSG